MRFLGVRTLGRRRNEPVAGAARMAVHLRMARRREEPAGGGLGQRPRGAGRGEGGSANRRPLVAGLMAGILRDDVAQ